MSCLVNSRGFSTHQVIRVLQEFSVDRECKLSVFKSLSLMILGAKFSAYFSSTDSFALNCYTCRPITVHFIL